jgi:hypothetical protein
MKKYALLKMEILKIDIDVITASDNLADRFEEFNNYDDVISDFGS